MGKRVSNKDGGMTTKIKEAHKKLERRHVTQIKEEKFSYRVTFDTRAGGARLADFGQRSSFGFSGFFFFLLLLLVGRDQKTTATHKQKKNYFMSLVLNLTSIADGVFPEQKSQIFRRWMDNI